MEEDLLGKSAHKVFKIKYHFVFCIKYRKDLFLEEKYVEFLKEICKGIEERYSIRFETMGFDEDHVHFMIQTYPRFSPSEVFRVVKSITARKLFEKYPDIKKELWGGEFWSDGGFVGTVGEGINAEIIRKYIKNQGRKPEQLKLVDFV
ncbi:IS200/IS605 family transposase [Candidatus Pacearchaeota archaeon]|nr:IS200/IS605 family transposase [Candidatus Pacearchaeota archaeon]|tara:strand:- start:1602 stop:2045 length:444 start_codon:yes stop_codon:yes gene_type:complete